ncbi:methyltransferase domain-containing protein [Candidatus Bathyarchaeota archaeon]|nr:methyltransferase domain-containing protein [Candidatus Bathyarchaeota archaeon]
MYLRKIMIKWKITSWRYSRDCCVIKMDGSFEEIITGTYEAISADFNRSRGTKPWKPLVHYLEIAGKEKKLASGPIPVLLDAGCGNLRNAAIFMDFFSPQHYIGLDLSFSLLSTNISRWKGERSVHGINASISKLPFRSGTMHIIASIAALHHAHEKQAIQGYFEEFWRILAKHEGTPLVIVSVWRKWQKRFRKKIIKQTLRSMASFGAHEEPGLVNVPWKNSKTSKLHPRHYLLLSKREVRKLVESKFRILSWEMLGGPGGKDNFFFCLYPIINSPR